MKRLALTAAAAALLLSLFACGPAPAGEGTPPGDTLAAETPAATTPAPEVPPTEAAAPAPTEAPGPEPVLYTLRLYNGTGATITALSFREESQPAYTRNLLAPGETLRDGEHRDLSYDAAPALLSYREAGTDAAEDSFLLPPEFRLLVLLEDGGWQELSAFPLEDTDEATLLMEEGLLYLSYESFTTGQLISTREAERWIRAWGESSPPDFSALTAPTEAAPAEAVPTEPVTEPEKPVSAPTEEVTEPDNPVSAPTEEATEEEDYDPDAGCLTGGLFH